MPSYYNPYMQNSFPVNTGYAGMAYPQNYQTLPQSYAAPPMQSNVIPVDGEVGAKAYMIPNGSTGPIALWDTNDNVIYLRTFNAAGMPNPLQKLRYVDETATPALPAAQSGNGEADMSKYVTRDDLDELRQEIRALAGNRSASNNQNGSQSRGNNNQGRQG